MSDGFYIQDTTTHGDLVLWWRPERRGYTVRLDKAGVYSEEDAMAIASIRGTDKPYPKAMIDAIANCVVLSDVLHRAQAVNSVLRDALPRGQR